ncbi:MAG: tyrosine-type recombinase/integrase [Caldilineaceae bacterium]|nr:tyrosine-type recombinase/integrase [Caldilineaceae bacterium]
MRHQSIREVYKLFQLDQRARQLSPRTIEFYDWKLPQFFEWCESENVLTFTELTPTHIKTYLIYQSDNGLSDYTVRGSAMAIRAFCRFVVREDLSTVNPFDGVRMPREPERVLPAFSQSDVQKLLRAARNHRDRALVMVLLDTGMRAAEAISLVGADVNIDAGEIIIRKGKGNRGRLVYLGAKSQKQLMLYFIRRGKPEAREPVFRTEDKSKGRISRSRFFKIFKELGRRAGVTPCTPHRFRRTFAITMARNGVNIHMIAKLMGHKDITVLKRYLDITQEDLRDAHRQASPTDNLL